MGWEGLFIRYEFKTEILENPKTIEHLSEGYKITKVNWLWCGKKSPVEGLEVKGKNKRNGKKKYCCYYFLFFVFLTFS